MPVPSVFPYIGAGVLLFILAIGFFRLRDFGAWPLTAASAVCLGVIGILPMCYNSAVDTADWVWSLDERSPRRSLSQNEIERFGLNAKSGVIYAASDGARKLYCIHYGNGDLLTALETKGSKDWDVLEDIGLCSDPTDLVARSPSLGRG